MYQLLILCAILIACNNNQSKTANISASKDSSPIQKVDSSFTKLRTAPQSHDTIEFQEYPFNDTIQVKKIQQLVSKIDSSKFKDSVYLENEEFMKNMTDGGGSLTGYIQNGKLTKIAEWYGLSWGILQVSYYFENDNLVFVKETEDHFYIDDSTGTDHSRFDTMFRGDYYFNKNKLFDEVTLGHNRFEKEDENAEKEYLERAKENRKVLLKHKMN